MANPNTVDSTYEIEDGYRQDILVTDVYVGYDDKYQRDGESVPVIMFEYEPIDGGETRTKFFSYGDGFDVSDDGKVLTHKSGEPKAPGGRTNYGKLLKSAIALPGCAKVLKSRGPSTDLNIWVGLAFELVDMEFPPAKEGQNPRRTTTLEAFYPNLCVPPIDGAATGTTTPAAPATPVEVGPNGLPLHVETALTALAQSSTSHPEFQERALAEVAGVEGNPDAETLITDAGFYETLKGA